MYSNMIFIAARRSVLPQVKAAGELCDGRTDGKRLDKNFDWGPLGGFTTFDFSARYKINEMISAGMNITNLFDTEQREYAGSSLIGRLIMFELKVHVPNKKD